MILSEYVSKQDWRAAFEAVIPPRKFVVDYRKQKKVKKDAAKAAVGAGDGAGNGEESGEELRPGEGEGEAELVGAAGDGTEGEIPPASTASH